MRARIPEIGTALLLVLLPFGLTAQQGAITGTVVDSRTGSPMSGVQIVALGREGANAGGGLSSDQGEFRLQLAAGSYALELSYLGRASRRLERIDVSAGGTTAVGPVALDETALGLDEIVVSVMPGVRRERRLETPTHIEVVGETQIAERAVTNPAELLRATPGVDIIQQGVQATNVVVRGFNNIFSGALQMLSDHRLAGVPSLKVNLLHFLPTNDEDIQRIEVVLGPGSALYGPNTANGVIHILTKSPLTHPGTTASIAAGERSVLQGEFRTAHVLAAGLGVKLSGQYLRGSEWPYTDATEVTNRSQADGNPAEFKAEIERRGFSAATAEQAFQRVGRRDLDLSRWGLDARGDWNYRPDGTLVLSAGRTVSSGIDLTGLGAGQTRDWKYSYYQARTSLGRLFAQAYLNTSDAGGSYLLRDGVPLIDKSSLFVSQVQHGFALWSGREQLTYGADYFHTTPRSEGTINGKYENDDVMDEWGVYAQSESALHPKLDLVLAGRLDGHSELPDNMFSPRAALVFKPTQGQALRFTYNRAYSNPTALNFFLDLSAGRAPDPGLAALGYRLRAQGVGSTGFYFRNADGTLRGMRSPFNPAAAGGAAQLIPVSSAAAFFPAAVGAAAQGAAAAGTPLPASLVQLLLGLHPTAAQIGVSVLDPSTRKVSSVAAASIPDVPLTRPETSTTYEVGYQGVLGGKLRIAVDGWRTTRKDFISPLTLVTPLLLLDGQQVGAFIAPPVVTALTQQLVATGLPLAQAQQQAAAQAAVLVPQLAAAIGSVPVGVVSEPNIDASGADLVVAYFNVGSVTLWGGDLGFDWFVDDRWTLSGSTSLVSDDWFEIEGGAPIALNAPKTKGSLSLAYRAGGLNGEARVRYTGEFPAESAGYVGTRCITGGTGGIFEDECVASATLLDLTAGWQVPRSRATLQVTVSNALDSPYRSFVGVPDIGRFAMVRLKYDLR